MNSSSQVKAYVFAGLTILFWSTVATAFKLGLSGLSPAELLFWSSLTSFLLLFFIALMQDKGLKAFKTGLKGYLHSAALGFLNPFLYYLVLFKAYSLLPAQVAQPLNMVWPIVLVFLSVPLLGSQVHLRTYLALLTCLGGVMLISSRGTWFRFPKEGSAGIFLSLGSSLIWSLFWLLNVKDQRDEVQKLMLNFFFATIYLLIYFLLLGGFHLPHWQFVAAGVYVGIFEMGLAFVFWIKALHIARSPDQLSSLMYLFPFLSLILIHFILGEQIYPTTFAGLFLIVAGIFLHKFRLFSKNPG